MENSEKEMAKLTKEAANFRSLKKALRIFLTIVWLAIALGVIGIFFPPYGCDYDGSSQFIKKMFEIKCELGGYMIILPFITLGFLEVFAIIISALRD